MPLTDLEIRRAKPAEKTYTKADGNGLSLQIEPNGSKGWRFRYRYEGKAKMLSLGTYPKVSLSEARSKRDEAQELLAAGINPSDTRKEKKLSQQDKLGNTFESITREWYKRRYDLWAESYRTEMIATFEKDVFPYIGHRPIDSITPMELMGVLSRLEKRGATEKMRKVRQRCGEVWKYAIATGRALSNPAPDLASVMMPHKKANYPHLQATELPDFLTLLQAYTGNILVKLAMKLLILTGTRPGELRKAEWSEFDFENNIWSVPEERMKMRRPHVVPLSRQALAILTELKTMTTGYQYVFPGRLEKVKPISDMSLNVLIRRIGYGGRATGHGFRHTMSTILHEQGFNSAWIELQLAHVDKNSIRGTYNHAQYLDGRREMMQWYADHIDSLSRGK
ncbi:tyrosine-type recombinase/integrase [Enterobacter kobei]|uniref:tyrosine-type recombinase/integrase n=1 Tax=Enterobacter kobei TaxID=208224 RepID=UPI002A51A4B6|nr:tyrosine-type recombinase/integrase [Enterobacter hormaechei]